MAQDIQLPSLASYWIVQRLFNVPHSLITKTRTCPRAKWEFSGARDSKWVTAVLESRFAKWHRNHWPMADPSSNHSEVKTFWEICGTRSQVGHSHASPLCKAQICLSVHELVCLVSTRQQLDKEQINSITDHVVRVKGFTGLIATRCASWTPTRQCRHTASWYNA